MCIDGFYSSKNNDLDAVIDVRNFMHRSGMKSGWISE